MVQAVVRGSLLTGNPIPLAMLNMFCGFRNSKGRLKIRTHTYDTDVCFKVLYHGTHMLTLNNLGLSKIDFDAKAFTLVCEIEKPDMKVAST